MPGDSFQIFPLVHRTRHGTIESLHRSIHGRGLEGLLSNTMQNSFPADFTLSKIDIERIHSYANRELHPILGCVRRMLFRSHRLRHAYEECPAENRSVQATYPVVYPYMTKYDIHTVGSGSYDLRK